MNTAHNGLTRQKGFSIMEILVAIVIFAIGMMALAHLQGNLTRSSANANVRTVATNIAEETIEGLRGFAHLNTDPAGILPAYQDIVTSSGVTETRGGIQYTINTTVSDWYYEIASDSFMGWADYVAAFKAINGNIEPTDAFSDFKLVTVNVAWDDTRPWLIDGTSSFTTDTSVTVAAVISSMSTAGSSFVTTQTEPAFFVPFIDFTPGLNPEIISLDLGGNRFKESSKPAPSVFRDNEIVETRFDVITYSQVDGSALFVRQEEFISVSCECVLKAPPGDAESAGRRPTLWAGDEYSEAHFVDKPYGVPNLGSNQQSQFCDVCCQDHHDGGTHEDDLEASAIKYDPFPNSSRQYWDSGTFNGDHKHYYPAGDGTLTLADSDGDLYLEACALVRKDGFFRVTQDFNQVGTNAFPEDFLDDTSEAGVYSNYVTGAVSTYESSIVNGYEASPPALTVPDTGLEEGDLWPNYTALPITIPGEGIGDPGTEQLTQQLRNRGIYIGYVSHDLQDVMDCVGGGSAVEDCEYGDVKLDQTGSTNFLEILPFFDVRLTLLARWNESPINNPIDTTNEAIVTGNLHSRGVASQGSRQGLSTVMALSHKGNLGFTATDPIEPNFSTEAATITVESLTGDTAIPPTVTVISATITSSVGGGLNASDIIVTAVDASCDRTPTGFTCAITGSNPVITLSGYGKDTPDNTIDRTACSVGVTKLNENHSDVNPWAEFSLAGLSQEVLYNINIKKGFTC